MLQITSKMHSLTKNKMNSIRISDKVTSKAEYHSQFLMQMKETILFMNSDHFLIEMFFIIAEEIFLLIFKVLQ